MNTTPVALAYAQRVLEASERRQEDYLALSARYFAAAVLLWVAGWYSLAAGTLALLVREEER